MKAAFPLDRLLQDHPDLKKVFAEFKKEGIPLFLVGGCVRDTLMRRKVKDIDLCSPLHPEGLSAMLTRMGFRVIDLGLEFGTVQFFLPKHAEEPKKHYEITSFRIDAETDGRRARVSFLSYSPKNQKKNQAKNHDLQSLILLDAKRRDFTINALYVDGQGTLWDFFEGVADIRLRKIRFIGDASERIQEDYLRILRFFRFMATHGFEAEPEGLQACAAHREGLKKISKERISQELNRLFAASKDIQTVVKALREAQILSTIFGLGKSRLDLKRFRPFIRNGHLNTWVRWAHLLEYAPEYFQNLRLSRRDQSIISKIHQLMHADLPSFVVGCRSLYADDGVDIRKAEIMLFLPKKKLAILHAARLFKKIPITGHDLCGFPDLPAKKRGIVLKQLTVEYVLGKWSTKAEGLDRIHV